MKIQDHEKLIIGGILDNPQNKDFIQSIVFDLDAEKFEQKSEREIYTSIVNLINKGEDPHILAVSENLGSKLNDVGGIEYLEVLRKFPDVTNINVLQGIGPSVRLVFNAGRLRSLKLVTDEYAKLFSDFEGLVQGTKNIDEFMGNFMSKVNSSLSAVTTSYKPFSNAIDEAIYYVERLEEGFNADIIPSGIPSLENFSIPRPGTLGVIIGLPSMGKTQFSILLALGVAKSIYDNKLDGVVSINSLETDGKRLAIRLASAVAGINTQDMVLGQLENMGYKKFIDTLESMKDLPIEYDDNPNISSRKFMWHAVMQHLQKKRVFGLSDYVELFKDKGDSEELRVSQATRNIRDIAWETESCEVIISQVNNKVHTTATKIAGLNNARYSGAIEAASDWGIEVWNPIQMRRRNIPFTLPDGKQEDFAYALIEKNKDYPVGEAKFIWVPEHKLFKDATLPYNEIYADTVEEADDF